MTAHTLKTLESAVPQVSQLNVMLFLLITFINIQCCVCVLHVSGYVHMSWYTVYYNFIEKATLFPTDAPCQDNSVRLVNGGVPGQGRIEICYNNQWGTICNDELDEVAAEVICRQLNFNNGQGEAAVLF